MRPRRPFRRPKPFPRRGNGPDRSIPPELHQALVLEREEKFHEAAIQFQSIAERAVRLGSPQAPRFYLQAARCYQSAGLSAETMECVWRAFQLFADEKRWAELHRSERRVRAGLMQAGWTNEIENLDIRLAQILDEAFHAEKPAGEPERSHSKPILPVQCPG
ncbi:MAG: hypothetical protein JW750_11860, partial [Anaerolineaceae bacterium]|nr:hypothetical protein [Anaerolineaceae bacterium]